MFFFLGRFLLSSVVSRGQFYKYWLCYLFTQIRSEQVLHRSMGSRANTQLDRSIHVMLEISSAAQLPLHTDAGKRASSFRAAAHHSLSKLPSSRPQNTRQPLKTSSSDCQNTAFAAFGHVCACERWAFANLTPEVVSKASGFQTGLPAQTCH